MKCKRAKAVGDRRYSASAGVADTCQRAQSPPALQTADAPPLFDSVFLAKLEQLHLLSRKLLRGAHRAERSSRQLGSSLEFADYRNYAFGDDLRSVDWNVYGRLDRLFVKLFEQEKDLHIYLLIDASASMRWRSETAEGPPRLPKLGRARRIAASLAYIGLANLDRVNVHWFGGELAGDLGLTRGRSQFHKVLDFLRRAPELPGETRLLASCRTFAQRVRRRGLVFLLSDLFDPAGCEEALGLLRHQQFETHVVQVLDPAELDPAHAGDLRLTESESGAAMEITADEPMLRRYRAEVAAFLEKIDRFCAERRIGCARASTGVPFEDLVLRVLRDGVMLR